MIMQPIALPQKTWQHKMCRAAEACLERSKASQRVPLEVLKLAKEAILRATSSPRGPRCYMWERVQQPSTATATFVAVHGLPNGRDTEAATVLP